MSTLDSGPERRNFRDALGQLDRYRLQGPVDQCPGELRSPILEGRSLAIGARYLIWLVPEEIEDKAALVERARTVDALGERVFPALIDHGELPPIGSGTPRSFLAFQGDAGGSLRGRLNRSALDLQDAVLMARRIAEALGALHGAGLVHGYLRPATVFLTVTGEVRLLLANLEDAGLHRERLEGRDQLGWAAAAYLSPEQLPEDLRPDSAGSPTAASDLWALGALLFEALSCDQPFHGRSFDAQARSIAGRDPEPIGPMPGLMPVELEKFFEHSLAKSTSARYSDAAAMIRDLEKLAKTLEPGDLRPASGNVPRGPLPPPALGPPVRALPTRRRAPLGGALGWLAQRRLRLRAEPGPAPWQLLLPPALLAALILLVAWWLWGS